LAWLGDVGAIAEPLELGDVVLLRLGSLGVLPDKWAPSWLVSLMMMVKPCSLKHEVLEQWSPHGGLSRLWDSGAGGQDGKLCRSRGMVLADGPTRAWALRCRWSRRR
jgi:hypothetical protein